MHGAMLPAPCERRAPYACSPGAPWRSAWPHRCCGTGSAARAGGHRAHLASARRPRARRSRAPRCATRASTRLQMWAYFAHFDMPDDDPDALLRRAARRLSDPRRPRARLGRDARPSGCSAPSAARRGPAARLALSLRSTGAGSSCPTARSPTSCCATAELFPRSAVLDGRLLRPRLRGLLAVPDRAAVVGGRRTATCRRCGGSWPRRASASGDASGSRSTVRSKAIHLLPCPRFTSVHR